ncbi:TetR/AcrR family transcriptional regulator [Tenacibaculum sp. Bg11-29]|uniref:TetR/AcrR family transcriptional regulator n=1 Tax=Tenacibaculum sp. Bg11-29 TaxID=2058306 RepID=UPI000C324AE9|nr:TetR/AcrR family transcriptional regulator [Tenacibaculum sp. Bg11-29]PKH49922.1 TetR/AcrR family transcriptional regulator [Tenacibaculum sp. Bg11-29]
MARLKEFDEIEILDKAMNLFWHKGYVATSAQDLVKELGISRSSLYDTFDDKKTLYIKSLKRYTQTQSTDLIDFLNSGNDFKFVINLVFNKIIKQSLEDSKKKGCFIVNSSIEFSCNSSEISNIINENNDKIKEAITELIKRSQDNGRLSIEIEAQKMSSFVYNNILGFRVMLRSGANKDELQDIVSLILKSY